MCFHGVRVLLVIMFDGDNAVVFGDKNQIFGNGGRCSAIKGLHAGNHISHLIIAEVWPPVEIYDVGVPVAAVEVAHRGQDEARIAGGEINYLRSSEILPQPEVFSARRHGVEVVGFLNDARKFAVVNYLPQTCGLVNSANIQRIVGAKSAVGGEHWEARFPPAQYPPGMVSAVSSAKRCCQSSEA